MVLVNDRKAMHNSNRTQAPSLLKAAASFCDSFVRPGRPDAGPARPSSEEFARTANHDDWDWARLFSQRARTRIVAFRFVEPSWSASRSRSGWASEVHVT
jgi:hypothetical protein